MITIDTFLSKIDYLQILGQKPMQVNMAHTNSKFCTSIDAFIAIKGNTVDGHAYIESVISQGCRLIICEDIPTKLNQETCYIQVYSTTHVAGKLIKECYQKPDEKLKLIGITGTNGKTTCATLLFELFKDLGFNVGLLSTVENKINNTVIPSTHTTPEVSKLYELLQQMVNNDVQYCFMEVSSHALVQQRVNGLKFQGAVFTNLTHDHLDYHGSFEEYRDAKKLLFDNLDSDAFALTNKDDKNGMYMLQNCKAGKFSYGLKSITDFSARVVEADFEGMELDIKSQRFWSSLIGQFNAYNLSAVFGVATLLDVTAENIVVNLSKLNKVKGRFEVIRSARNTIIIDYAHTPDALKNVIETINEIRKNNVPLTVVFGCGGNRDKEKRPKMGEIASKNANKIIITNDNPRFEKAKDIISQIQEGVQAQYYKNMLIVEDRFQAIKTALVTAQQGEVILIAGKGHENYQEIEGIKYPFDDSEIVKQIINELNV